jgi:hypothetical protein
MNTKLNKTSKTTVSFNMIGGVKVKHEVYPEYEIVNMMDDLAYLYSDLDYFMKRRTTTTSKNIRDQYSKNILDIVKSILIKQDELVPTTH